LPTKNHHRLIGFGDRDRMTLAIIVGNARRHHVLGMGASASTVATPTSAAAMRKARVRSRGVLFVIVSVLIPREPGSLIGDKTKISLIVSDRFDAA